MFSIGIYHLDNILHAFSYALSLSIPAFHFYPLNYLNRKTYISVSFMLNSREKKVIQSEVLVIATSHKENSEDVYEKIQQLLIMVALGNSYINILKSGKINSLFFCESENKQKTQTCISMEQHREPRNRSTIYGEFIYDKGVKIIPWQQFQLLLDTINCKPTQKDSPFNKY